jgi:hypothetical protein
MKSLFPALTAVALICIAAPMLFADGQFDRTLKVSGPVDLDVMTDSGGIIVTTGSSAEVHIHAILRAQRGWFGQSGTEADIRELERNPPVEQMGNRVRVGYARNPALLRHVSMRLEIQTPPDTRLRARADSGGIRAGGIHGPADCQTDSGGIELRDIGADVHATADSGGIRIRQVNGAVHARADSGGIEALDVAGRIDVQTDSGGIQLSQTTAAPIRADVDSGGVHARLAPGAGYDLFVETSSGPISVPQLTESTTSSRHRVNGKLRGGGPSVNIHADSGSVSIN